MASLYKGWCLPICLVLSSCASLQAAPLEKIDVPPGLEQNSAGATPRDAAPLPAATHLDLKAEGFRAEHQNPAIERARASLHQGEIQACLEQLQDAAQADPALPPHYLMLAYLYLSEGRWQEGSIALESAATAHKNHPEVYQALAQLAAATGRNADAWAHYQLAIRLPRPQGWSDDIYRSFQARNLQGMAEVCERRRDWTEAREVFSRWADLTNPDAAFISRWAKATLLAGSAEGAYAHFAHARRLEPTRNLPELAMGSIFTETGQYDKAQQWYEKALEKYPDDGRARFEYAGSLLLAGKVAEAKQRVQEALKLKTNLKGMTADIYLLIGLIARSEKDYERAEEFFTRVLEESPGHFMALSQLPLVLIEQDDKAKRRRALHLALIHSEKNPDSPMALTTLGGVQYRSGQVDEAEKTLTAAAASGVPDGETLYLLAQVLLEKGKAGESKGIFQALEDRISQPGLFITRNDAKAWLKSVSLALQE